MLWNVFFTRYSILYNSSVFSSESWEGKKILVRIKTSVLDFFLNFAFSYCAESSLMANRKMNKNTYSYICSSMYCILRINKFSTVSTYHITTWKRWIYPFYTELYQCTTKFLFWMFFLPCSHSTLRFYGITQWPCRFCHATSMYALP